MSGGGTARRRAGLGSALRGGSARRAGLGVALSVAALAAACAGEERSAIVLSSTTSTEDSGLFDVLIPAFEAAHPSLRVRVLAVGSGQALELGRRGDADVLLTHAPTAESVFVAQGHGEARRAVMYNDFVLVGPAADPAGVRGESDAAAALARIAAAVAPFISRGDDSGTHRKELDLWEAAGLGGPEARGPGYLEAGQGMGEVLRVAAEKEGYTLSDRSTFLFLRDLPLEVLLEGDPRLTNPYGVIVVRKAKNRAGGRAFADWITSPAGQAVVGDYGRARFGQPLFFPGEPPGGHGTVR